MPEKIKKALTAEAEKKGLKGKRKKAYIYGTLHKFKVKHTAMSR